MSRIGKKIITIPNGVTVTLDASLITVKGPKGELSQKIHPEVIVTQDAEGIKVAVKDPEIKDQRALWGLFGSLIKNMIIGVTEGYTKSLEVNGVGYKVALQGKKLVLQVGYSHPVEFPLPAGINAVVEGNVIKLDSADKQLVGEMAAQIRKIRKPEPYKGKGIKYTDEVIRRKAGKTAAKA
ncbi:MAG: 50S ribosomal protein L6 [Janthinobacterium sp.]|jgi:large subunit ribosomal protein L6